MNKQSNGPVPSAAASGTSLQKQKSAGALPRKPSQRQGSTAGGVNAPGRSGTSIVASRSPSVAALLNQDGPEAVTESLSKSVKSSGVKPMNADNITEKATAQVMEYKDRQNRRDLLQDELSEVKEELANLEKQMRKLKEEENKLGASNHIDSQKLESIRAQVKRDSTELDVLRTETAQLSGTCSKLSEGLKETTQKCEEADEDLRQKREQMATMQHALNEAEKEVKRLKEAKMAKTKERDRVNQKIQQATRTGWQMAMVCDQTFKAKPKDRTSK
uniref:Uncharacterized protein n=1 Tax=Chromera velia CCMP2878 TaxID=1169474 RepID=A0A0G4H6F2_9ALVE|mmetsp:Transcript_49542/g.97549  ORF Transcript_49542/g.97549 Transcript_49542/m.97549 type:complete len:274 (-) Transcript_49542:9-830(-)|eukprot:Cvel_5755.t1-p1 / transcript=Cvel_5755.t1 / gene=Cvel_5755 / organism=Chromera_velia_CCMP2878 / gene_product=MAR-binding filament-like protein 1-1, putative / transcript_product=MAR-binding filament-like protein 1-1, putative / location=Cvel_scaffold273:62068-65232(+) / protein_length=273 / sequence_SO=supercontig / SO=protein_coding / is_pseudo=false